MSSTPPLPPDHDQRMREALLSLEGLSLGDAFGEQMFTPAAMLYCIPRREPPPPRWRYTDDTEMAMVIVDVLRSHGHMDQDALAQRFAERYAQDPHRGYGPGAQQLLAEILRGGDWRDLSPRLFGGEGSMGNGGAMRVAPLGAYFAADDYDLVATHAARSAQVTHAHQEGQAGAIAVAIAAAWVVKRRVTGAAFSTSQMFPIVLEHTPLGATADGIRHAAQLLDCGDLREVVAQLGNGSKVIASDTVPLCLWCAARHLQDFASAMWTIVAAGGDRDTTAAIVGGIIALAVERNGLPPRWLAARESLG